MAPSRSLVETMTAGAPAALPGTTASISPELGHVLATICQAVPGAYLVGGAVRDLLTNRQPVDLDIVTSGDAHAAAESAGQAFGAGVFALDEARGHYRVTLPEGGLVSDIDLSSADDVIVDLKRRDFTVDAMAFALRPDGSLGEIIDPTSGRRDLDAGTLRMVSEAVLREDPLRLLRAARLAHELDLEIEPETELAIRENAFLLPQAAPERQREELVRMLATQRSARAIRLLDALTLLQELLPEITAARGVGQPFEHHYWDVFDHSVEALAALDEMLAPDPAPDRWLARTFRDVLSGFELDRYLDEGVGGHSRLVLVKLAALLHDVAKPETKTEEPDGKVRFLGHSERGAETAARICRRLRFGNRETQFVALLVEEHLRPTQLSQGDLPSKRALYRYFRDLGDAAPACLFLSLADAAAARGPRLEPERWSGHVRYVAWVLEHGSGHNEAIDKEQRLVDGATLITALGLTPGPLIGRLLDAIDEAHAIGEVTSREEALDLARTLLASPPAAASPSPRAARGIEDETSGDLDGGSTTGSPSAHRAKDNPLKMDNLPTETPRLRSRGGGRGEGLTHAPRLKDARPVNWQRIRPHARQMRHSPTPAEDRLWQALRRKQLGVNFRRQHPINRLVVDFYCPDAGLVVEVDGPIHDEIRDQDEARQDFLEALGLQVLRFKNEDVIDHLDRVLALIRATIDELSIETPPRDPGEHAGGEEQPHE